MKSPKGGEMPEFNDALPLLALTSGVVFPGMATSIALETDDARAAADAAGSAGGRLVLVPRIDGRYASIGTLGEIVEVGEIPAGTTAIVVRATGRAAIGSAVPSTGQALWVQV